MEQHELGDFLARFSAGVGNQPEADMTMLQRLEVALCRAASAFPDGKPYWMARAALEAMREPTPRMIGYGAGCSDFILPEAIGSGPEHLMREMGIAWRAMIDAALEKQPS